TVTGKEAPVTKVAAAEGTVLDRGSTVTGKELPVTKVAAADGTVLDRGSTVTGKEVPVTKVAAAEGTVLDRGSTVTGKEVQPNLPPRALEPAPISPIASALPPQSNIASTEKGINASAKADPLLPILSTRVAAADPGIAPVTKVAAAEGTVLDRGSTVTGK